MRLVLLDEGEGLVEVDGFEANEGVFIISTSSRPDVLNPDTSWS